MDEPTAPTGVAEWDHGPREFRVTFGGRYPRETDSQFPGADHDGWLAVLAWDYREAHQAVVHAIGSDWANLYAPHSAAYPTVNGYPQGELGYLDGTLPSSRREVISR